MIIDSHCHLTSDAFKEDFDIVLKRSIDSGVKSFIMIGCDPKSNLDVLNIAKKHNFIYPTVGVHPTDVKDLDASYLVELENLIKNNKVYAVGECGLDYYWDKDNKESQKEFFIAQIELAIKYNLPLIVHSREATNDTYEILKKYKGKVKFVLHAYSGSSEMALRFVEIGGLLGIGGVVTFKNALNVKDSVKAVGLDNIILETDCPYLTPHPFRGQRNEPSYLTYVAEEISLLLDCDVEEVENKTTLNCVNFFKI